MTISVLELNDNEIRVGSNGDIVLRSPGYAQLVEDKIEIGEAAARQARLHPRASHNRYWKNLNQEPLQYPSPLARHNADLAFAQLLRVHEQAGKPAEVIVAVPAVFSNTQLSLLLGLIGASPFEAVGLVDSAVAATSLVAGRGNYVHVDMHLHQTILTRISVDERVSRTSVQLVDGVGMSSIFDATAHLIADLFIKESRFDPQHHPETEQALYDQIPACLNTLRTHAEVSLEVQYQQTQHQAKLTAELLINALQSQYEKIVKALAAADICLLSHRLGQLPGLTARLTKAEILSELAVIQACQLHEADIRSSGSTLNYVTSLPASSEPVITELSRNPEASNESAIDSSQDITHLLHGHKAYSLNKGRLYLSASGVIGASDMNDSHCYIDHINGSFSLELIGQLTVFVNGRQIKQNTQIEAGDIISFVGSKTEYSFIHVND